MFVFCFVVPELCGRFVVVGLYCVQSKKAVFGRRLHGALIQVQVCSLCLLACHGKDFVVTTALLMDVVLASALLFSSCHLYT